MIRVIRHHLMVGGECLKKHARMNAIPDRNPAREKRAHQDVPKGYQVKLFQIASSTGRTEYIVTNDLSQSDADATHQECRMRWKIEQLHREIKQVTVLANVKVASCVPKEIISHVVFKYRSV